MSQVFISYSRESHALAETLVEDIQQSLRRTVWFDKDLAGGQSWWDRILANIRSCDVFVYVLTPHSINSVACQREHSYAATLGKAILPVLMSDEVSTALLPPALAQLQFVDYRSRDMAAAFSLAQAFATLPAPPPLPAPLPAPPDVPISYLGEVAQRLANTSALSYEEQSAMLIDLKGSLRNSASAVDARVLLHEFRKRRDLLAAVADEIDMILEQVRLGTSQQAREKAGSTSSTISGRLTTSALPALAPTPRERLLGALAGVGVGIFINVVLLQANRSWGILGDYWFINGLAGAVVGAIGGKRKKVAGSALAASVVGWLVLLMVFGVKYKEEVLFTWLLGAGPCAFLGAIAAVIYLKLRRRSSAKAASA